MRPPWEAPPRRTPMTNRTAAPTIARSSREAAPAAEFGPVGAYTGTRRPAATGAARSCSFVPSFVPVARCVVRIVSVRHGAFRARLGLRLIRSRRRPPEPGPGPASPRARQGQTTPTHCGGRFACVWTKVPNLPASERVIGPDALKSAVLVDESREDETSERVTQRAGSRTAKRQGCPVESPTPHLRLGRARTPRHHDLRRYQPAPAAPVGRSRYFDRSAPAISRSSRSSSCERRWPTGGPLRGTVLRGCRDQPDQIRPSFARGAGIAETIPPQVQGVATVLRESGFTPTAITLESGSTQFLKTMTNLAPLVAGTSAPEIATATTTRRAAYAQLWSGSADAAVELRTARDLDLHQAVAHLDSGRATILAVDTFAPAVATLCTTFVVGRRARRRGARRRTHVERRTFETALQRALEMSKLEGRCVRSRRPGTRRIGPSPPGGNAGRRFQSLAFPACAHQWDGGPDERSGCDVASR